VIVIEKDKKVGLGILRVVQSDHGPAKVQEKHPENRRCTQKYCSQSDATGRR